MLKYDDLRPILDETNNSQENQKIHVVSYKLAIYNISVYTSLDDSDCSFS